MLYESITLKPPFRAEDMEGLYKKVTKGLYPKLPKQFSKDLSMIIKVMLRVTAAKRPTCSQILNTNIISSRLNTLFPNELSDDENELLQTIYIPKKLTYLTERLPKANYEDNEESEDETVISKYYNDQGKSDSLPKLIASSQKMVNINSHQKHKYFNNDQLQVVSKNIAKEGRGKNMLKF